MEYYILCKRHGHVKDYAFLFWGPKHQGYTFNVDHAGKYTKEEVEKHFPADRNDCDSAVYCAIVDDLSKLAVIDRQTLGRVVCNTPQTRRLLKVCRAELLKGGTAWDYRAFCSPEEYKQAHKHTLALLAEINLRCTKLNPDIFKEKDGDHV